MTTNSVVQETPETKVDEVCLVNRVNDTGSNARARKTAWWGASDLLAKYYKFIKSNRIRRVRKVGDAHTKPVRKRLLGRPSHRWKDNVKRGEGTSAGSCKRGKKLSSPKQRTEFIVGHLADTVKPSLYRPRDKIPHLNRELGQYSIIKVHKSYITKWQDDSFTCEENEKKLGKDGRSLANGSNQKLSNMKQDCKTLDHNVWWHVINEASMFF